MSLSGPMDWVHGEDLAQLSDADRRQVLHWLRECGVNPDRTRAIRIEASDADQPRIVAHRPIAVGMRGIEMHTETYVLVGEIPEPLTERSN